MVVARAALSQLFIATYIGPSLHRGAYKSETRIISFYIAFEGSHEDHQLPHRRRSNFDRRHQPNTRIPQQQKTRCQPGPTPLLEASIFIIFTLTFLVRPT